MEIGRRWKMSHPDRSSSRGLDIEMVESPGLSLLSMIAGYQAAVLVDAMQSGIENGRRYLSQISSKFGYASQ
ncbi:MAG: hypothetical protein R6U51_00700 [Anaerolineales bacterium]